MHEYKQYPQAWSLPVHLRLHLFIMTTGFLCPTSFPCHFLSCVWPHRKTSDCSLCLIRALDSVCGATLRLTFLSTLGSCCNTPGTISGHTTSLGNQVESRALPQPTSFYEVCSCFLQTHLISPTTHLHPASVLQSPGSLKTPCFFLPQDLCTCSFLCPKGSFSILLLSFI